MAIDERNASRRTTASTAEGAALIRAIGTLERDPAVRNPDDMAIRFVAGGLRLPALIKVPGLRRMMPRVLNRMAPGNLPFEVARTKHIDAVLRSELAGGIEQLVLLGAGYDTRPYRLADELAGVTVFEVDHPSMSAIKRAKVTEIVGELPSSIRYVEIDFNEQRLDERLADSGHDPAAPTFFIWSGVAPYLPDDAVGAVLDFVGSQGSERTSIIFDYLYREVLDGERFYGSEQLLRLVARMGEPLRSGIPRGTTAEYLTGHGLRLESDMTAEEGTRRYLMRSDGTPFGRMWEFGGFAHARVAAAG